MDQKKLGTIAEVKFISRAMENGLNIAEPVGDYGSYDLIADRDGHLFKIQIKSTESRYTGTRGDCYKILAGKGGSSKTRYTSSDCDFIAVYVHPHDSWYIIPVEVVTSVSVRLYPHRSGVGQYEQYREQWSTIKKISS